MAIVCQSRGSPRPYLYGSSVQNMQRHARIYTGPAGRGLITFYYEFYTLHNVSLLIFRILIKLFMFPC